ncbi:MAG: hypothetical protein IPF99_23210 [Deltaproteobacteria bacterium]|nr:hypothetical protein [Deltaproteobacteria bacterium]
MAGRVVRLAYPHRREALALAEELREARSGGYWIAVGADAGVRRAVLALLRRELEGTDVLAVRLSADEPGPWRTLGAKALRAKKAASLVMVVELPVVATGEDEAPGRHPVELLRRLNVGREIAPGRGWRVVLWTTLGRVPDLTEWMPDIWAYRRSVAWMPGSADFVEAARRRAVATKASTRYRVQLREAEGRLKWASGATRLGALLDAAQAAAELGLMPRTQRYLREAEALVHQDPAIGDEPLHRTLSLLLYFHPRRQSADFRETIEKYAADPIWQSADVTSAVVMRHRMEADSRMGRFAAVAMSDPSALLNLAGDCLDRGRLQAARVMESLAQVSSVSGVQRDHAALTDLAFLDYHAGLMAQESGETFDALCRLHGAVWYFAQMQAEAMTSIVQRLAANLYQAIGLRDEAASLRAQAKARGRGTDSRSIPDDKLLPLDRMNRFLDRAERAFAHHDLPAAGAALSVARDAWAAEDADFRSLYGLGRIRRLEARLLVTRGDVSSALRTLQGALASVEAEGLIHERFRLLIAIAALPPAADIDLTRYDAARDALSIADRTRYVEEEIEALLRLSAAARSLGRREEARTHADRAAEIRRQVGRRPPRALEHGPSNAGITEHRITAP